MAGTCSEKRPSLAERWSERYGMFQRKTMDADVRMLGNRDSDETSEDARVRLRFTIHGWLRRALRASTLCSTSAF